MTRNDNKRRHHGHHGGNGSTSSPKSGPRHHHQNGSTNHHSSVPKLAPTKRTRDTSPPKQHNHHHSNSNSNGNGTNNNSSTTWDNFFNRPHHPPSNSSFVLTPSMTATPTPTPVPTPSMMMRFAPASTTATNLMNQAQIHQQQQPRLIATNGSTTTTPTATTNTTTNNMSNTPRLIVQQQQQQRQPQPQQQLVRIQPTFMIARPPPPPPPTTTTAQTHNNGVSNNNSLATVPPPRAPQVHRDGVAMPFIAREFDHRRVQEFHLAPADAELLAACPTPCHITVSRPDVQHLIVLDLDNVPDFFLKCDLAQRDLSRAIGGVRLIPSGTLVFCFYNDVSRVRLPSLTAGTDTFYHLLENKMLEMDQATAKKKNSADMALAVSVGRLTMMTPKSVPITIISEDSVFDELIRRSDASRKFMRFTRYLSQGLATPDMYNTHLDFFHHLHMRLLGKRVDLSVRHTKAPFNSVDYTMARTVSSQVATTTEHGVLKVVDF
eukprot:PhM_4_TR11614/c4_g1_i2/m.9800